MTEFALEASVFSSRMRARPSALNASLLTYPDDDGCCLLNGPAPFAEILRKNGWNKVAETR